jgi:hypothetical protein
MSNVIITPEKYIYFKTKDIAAMCVDVALTILCKDDIGFNKKRKIRNMIANKDIYKVLLEEIANNINDIGKK